MHSQIGKVSISFELIEKDLESAIEILSKLKCIPVKLEVLYYENCIVYTGYSSKFRKIEHGEIIPSYKIIVKKNDHGTITSVAAEEVKGE